MLKKHHWPAILWAMFILIICGIPGDKFPRLKFGLDLFMDKVVHIIIFGILLILMIWNAHRKGSLMLRDIIISMLVVSLYGGIIEVLQAYIFINRSGDVADWIADTVGAIIGWLLLKTLVKKTAL